MKACAILIILCELFFLAGCGSRQISTNNDEAFSLMKPVSKEIMRVKSPDSKVDAVVITRDVGATSAEATFIYLIPHGRKINENDDDNTVFIGDYVKNLNVLWSEWRFLEIHYDEARISKFKNYWESQEVDDYHYHVEIKLFPKEGNSLPLNLRTW